jgi:transposase
VDGPPRGTGLAGIAAHRVDLLFGDQDGRDGHVRLGPTREARGIGTGAGTVRNYNSRSDFVDCVRKVHRKRDFHKLIDRGGPAEAIGRVGLEVVECLFADGWAFRRGELDRAGLQARSNSIARELQAVLEQGCSCADSKAATFCANLLALYPALWLFTTIDGVEPTNNHAERILRSGVLWRKNAFGCHSPAGCRFVERMLTVVQTLRLQKRPVIDYLYRAILAHRSGLPAPQLLGQAGN